MQHVNSQAPCKESTWKADKEMGGNIRMKRREIGCDDRKEMELTQTRVQWGTLVFGRRVVECWYHYVN
jgi:hypothetical protein